MNSAPVVVADRMMIKADSDRRHVIVTSWGNQLGYLSNDKVFIHRATFNSYRFANADPTGSGVLS